MSAALPWSALDPDRIALRTKRTEIHSEIDYVIRKYCEPAPGAVDGTASPHAFNIAAMSPLGRGLYKRLKIELAQLESQAPKQAGGRRDERKS